MEGGREWEPSETNVSRAKGTRQVHEETSDTFRSHRRRPERAVAPAGTVYTRRLSSRPERPPTREGFAAAAAAAAAVVI